MIEETIKFMKYPSGLIFLCFFSISAHAEGEFEANVGLLLGYDSNVAIDEIDVFTTNGDGFVTGRFRLAYTNDFNNDQSVKLSYNLSDKRYRDNGQFDLQNQLASISYNIKYEEITFGLSYRYVDANLNSKQFLTLSQVNPSASWFISKQHYLRLAYTFHDKTLEYNSGRDANSHEFSANYYYFVNGFNSYFIVALKTREENAASDVFNYSAQQLRIAYQKRFDILDSPIKATINVQARRRDYNEAVNPLIQDYRLDKNYSSSFSLEWGLSEHWLVDWQIEYSDRQSNFDSVDFSQWLSTAGFEYRF